MSEPTLVAWILIAASSPIVLSILIAVRAQPTTVDVSEYFLYGRNLDLDGFLKASIGYSLQVASIYLFFDWALRYGLYAIFVPIAWGLGYFCLAFCVETGKLDDFLKFRTDCKTIHGYIWDRLGGSRDPMTRITVAVVTLSTMIGVGGSLMTELDYSTKFLMQALSIQPTPNSVFFERPDTFIQVSLLVLTIGYVLWGGYRAVVETERFQVPAAYAAFSLFGVLLLLSTSLANTNKEQASVVALISWSMTAVLLLLIFNRHRITTVLDKPLIWHVQFNSAALLVLIPLIFLAIYSAIVSSSTQTGSFHKVYELLFPAVPELFGFGFVGATSLIITNMVWQFIDISSLQRLQSVDVSISKAKIARSFRIVGVEACAGWTLILLVGLIFKVQGIDDVGKVPEFLFQSRHFGGIMLPLMLFAVIVFMLSTVSGFISSLAYVSYFDLLRLVDNRSTDESALPNKGKVELYFARWGTILAMIILFAMYLALKAGLTRANPNEPADALISQALYAVYAFQLAILPTVLAALFGKVPLNQNAVLLSTLVGIVVAWITATAKEPWFGIAVDSWYVIPPLFVTMTSALVYMSAGWINAFHTHMHGRR